jgi:hypothetical protein
VGRGWRKGAGREMTQTIFAHVNKIKKKAHIAKEMKFLE